MLFRSKALAISEVLAIISYRRSVVLPVTDVEGFDLCGKMGVGKHSADEQHE